MPRSEISTGLHAYRSAPPLSKARPPRHARHPAVVHHIASEISTGLGDTPPRVHQTTSHMEAPYSKLEHAFLAAHNFSPASFEHVRRVRSLMAVAAPLQHRAQQADRRSAQRQDRFVAATEREYARAHPSSHLGFNVVGGLTGVNNLLRMTTGIDAGRVLHPVRAYQQDVRPGQEAYAAYKRGEISREEAMRRSDESLGIILDVGKLPGIGRLLRRVRRGPAEAVAPEVAAEGRPLFGKETVTRPRTRLEAEARLKQLDRKIGKLADQVAKKTGHPYAEADIAAREQLRRNKINGLIDLFERTGQRKPGTAKALRTGRLPRVAHELHAHVGDVLDEIALKHPEHPAVRAYVAAETERNQLSAALSSGELFAPPPEVAPDLGTVSETRFAPGEQVRRSLGAARRLRAEQKKLYSAERGARIERGQQALEEAGGGIAGFKAGMREQRGALPKTTFDRLREGKLATADVERLVQHAQNHPELGFWQKQNVTKALLDAFEHGRTPTPSEIKLLQTTFGQEAAASLSKTSALVRAGRMAVDVSNIPRTVMASVDLSAPFRQGLVAGARHPNLFVRNFGPMIRAFGSDRVYQAILEDIHARPTFEQMQEAGVKFTELGHDLGKREEQFISRAAEKIPLVRNSARAYTGFLDKMRADMFDRQLELARKQGVNVEDREQLRSIARLVNNATGRGDLGPVEHWAPAMNAFFFSPRLIGSRINMLNPVWYATLTPFARKQALISMIRLGSVAAGVLGIGSYLGAKVGTDPRSADFAKLRIGNTRADVLGGFQQYVRVGSQLATGKIISSTTGKTMTLGPGFGGLSRKDIAERFVVGKFAPPPSFVYDFFKGTQFDGQPFSVKKAILQRTVPLVAQDAYDLYHSADSVPLALLGYSISAFGIGMQTYAPRQAKSRGGGPARPEGSLGGGGRSLLRGGSAGGSHSLLRK